MESLDARLHAPTAAPSVTCPHPGGVAGKDWEFPPTLPKQSTRLRSHGQHVDEGVTAYGCRGRGLRLQGSACAEGFGQGGQPGGKAGARGPPARDVLAGPPSPTNNDIITTT